jgi:hypothetical protein
MLPGRTGVNHESPVRIGVPAEIRIENLPKTSLERYHHATLPLYIGRGGLAVWIEWVKTSE